MMRRLYEGMSRINQGYGTFMNRIGNVETFGSMVFGVLFLGAAWALAWYGHIIFPWLENLLDFGPYDIDSAGKIRWRRIWSTSICLPGILACIGLYIRNRRK